LLRVGQPVTSDIARSANLTEARGVIVGALQPDSAAARAGLRQGDIITALNGEAVNESNELRNRVANTPPGTEITLTILRDGGEQQLRATLSELSSAANRSVERDE
jgi:S1-C subfamily serine protease